MILKKVEGRRNPRAWHGSRLTVSGLHGHPSTPNPRPKRRVETPGDPWGVPQPPGPSSPAYGTPPTANRWFLPLSSSQWGQTLPTTSVMFPVRIEPRGHAQGGKKIPGGAKGGWFNLLFLENQEQINGPTEGRSDRGRLAIVPIWTKWKYQSLIPTD